jgi:meso-butanediol dehydrogenase / (S,S)-butanediol dehydrogenase / diacetyl reductase
MPRLNDKFAFITGAGTGIGRACAVQFAREGAAVALAGRRIGPLEEVARTISGAGGQAMAVVCDVTLRGPVERALEAAEARFGQINVVVNNAGAVVVADVGRTSDEDWDRIIATNLTGKFLVSRAALPVLRRSGGGSIVNIGSILGVVARKDRAAYCASKGGVTLLTKAMALDHAHENIRVNCICPTIVETDLGMESIAATPDPAAERNKRALEIPLGRMGRPEDVAYLAVLSGVGGVFLGDWSGSAARWRAHCVLTRGNTISGCGRVPILGSFAARHRQSGGATKKPALGHRGRAFSFARRPRVIRTTRRWSRPERRLRRPYT